MIEYRVAMDYDVAQLVGMAWDFFQVSGVKEFGATFNPDHVRDMLKNMISNPDSVVMVAVTTTHQIYGAIGAHLSHHVMNRDQGLVMEMFQWVRPEARRHGIGGTLRCGVEEWGKSKGAVTIAMMSMHEIEGPAVAQFMSSGYKPTETVWMKRL